MREAAESVHRVFPPETRRSRRRPALLLVAGLALVIPATSAGAVASRGAAAPVARATLVVADQTCPTTAYEPGQTVPCIPTTVPPALLCPATPALEATFTSGRLSWQAFNYPTPAVGTVVTLLVDGRAVSTAIDAGTCVTTGPDDAQSVSSEHSASVNAEATVPLCLGAGTHTAVAVDPGYPDTNTVTFTVATDEACASPVDVATATTPSATAAPGGLLAFTGANVARLAVLALCAIALGAVLTRTARRRRWS